MVIISKNIDIGFSGVSRASNWRKESGAGMTISTNIFISSAIIMAPIESSIVAIITCFEIAFKRRDSIIESCLRFKKIKTGTIKKAWPTNIEIYVESPGVDPSRIDGSNALNIDAIISAEKTDNKTIQNANGTERVRFMRF